MSETFADTFSGIFCKEGLLFHLKNGELHSEKFNFHVLNKNKNLNRT